MRMLVMPAKAKIQPFFTKITLPIREITPAGYFFKNRPDPSHSRKSFDQEFFRL